MNRAEHQTAETFASPCFDKYFLGVPRVSVVLALVFLLAGCAGSEKRPVFYPNPHLEQVGMAAGQRDIDACMDRANAHGVAKNKDGQVGEKAAKGAVLGGIGSAAWGLVRGDAGERALAGAAAGAATGAAAGGFESTKLNPTYQRFVERCLQERGYDVIGWE